MKTEFYEDIQVDIVLLDDGELLPDVLLQFPASQPDGQNISYHDPELTVRYSGLIYVPFGIFAAILIFSTDLSFTDVLFVLGVGLWLLTRLNRA